jgi:hypothetical protein
MCGEHKKFLARVNTGKILLDSVQVIISNLESIKKELVPKCKHPKNMRDRVGNQWYCMNCNWDF